MEESNLEIKFTWDDVKLLADKLLLPECPACADRPSEENDFVKIKPSIEAGFISADSQLTHIQSTSISPEHRQGIVALLLACGEHSKANTWTSEITLKCSESILNKLCDIYKCLSINDIINSGPILKSCLSIFCAKLTREKWRSFPAAVASFWWIISHVETPVLGEHLAMVFPPTLLVLDDFDVDNKILGCKMMNHIINNVTRSELKRRQLDDVLYEALHRLLYQREAGFVVPVVTCLSSLLTKVDSSHTQKLEMERIDSCLGVFLRQMEMEQGLVLRQEYAQALPVLLRVSNLSLLRWSQRLFRIFSEYLTIEDGSHGVTQEHVLQALLWHLQQTWPRAHTQAPAALNCLLRLLHDLVQTERTLSVTEETRLVLMGLVEQCLAQLVLTAPQQCREELTGAHTLPFGPEFHQVLNRTVLSNKNNNSLCIP